MLLITAAPLAAIARLAVHIAGAFGSDQESRAIACCASVPLSDMLFSDLKLSASSSLKLSSASAWELRRDESTWQ